MGVSGHTSLLRDHRQEQITVASVDAWHDRSKCYFATVVFFQSHDPSLLMKSTTHNKWPPRDTDQQSSNIKWSPPTRAIKRTARRHHD